MVRVGYAVGPGYREGDTDISETATARSGLGTVAIVDADFDAMEWTTANTPEFLAGINVR